VVSLSAVKRLSDQVRDLEDRVRPIWKSIFVRMGEGIDKGTVLARHDELFPEDPNPDLVFVTLYEGDYTECAGNKANRAWRELVRERASA
jgi:hypothetical protein